MARTTVATAYFTLAVQRMRRITTRSDCGFTTAPAGLADVAAVRSSASCKPPAARFIVRLANGGCYEIQNLKLGKLGDFAEFSNRRFIPRPSQNAFAAA
jgi:hypothetical protein